MQLPWLDGEVSSMAQQIKFKLRQPAAFRPRLRLPGVQLALASLALLLAACGTAPPAATNGQAAIPVLRGWFDGDPVFYITTDVSHADLAEAKGANFAPRLADALPGGPPVPGRRSSVDKVYAVTNFKQESIFASAPDPMGPASRDAAYSPLWQMVKVTWAAGRNPHTLTSEEAVLAAADSGAVTLEPTRVVLNCPIVHRGPKGALPGVTLVHPVR
jgi:hypothetical protein